ncbi:MAG: GIY-YIG nuclease family protein, partial [Halanaerobiales bacterium]
MTFVVRDIPYDSGIYVLTVSLRDGREIEVGARGSIFFPGGYYYYCGSAQKNLSARLSRHLRTEKKFHWHIDYLLAWAEVLNFHTWSAGRKGECRLASCLQRLPG